MRAIDGDAFDERVRVAVGMSEEELTEDFKDGVQAVLYMLSNQPTIQPEPHWIPCSERQPKKCNTAYLATMDYGKYGRAVGQRFFFDDNIGWNDKTVIAWMPLPEEYRGEGW